MPSSSITHTRTGLIKIIGHLEHPMQVHCGPPSSPHRHHCSRHPTLRLHLLPCHHPRPLHHVQSRTTGRSGFGHPHSQQLTCKSLVSSTTSMLPTEEAIRAPIGSFSLHTHQRFAGRPRSASRSVPESLWRPGREKERGFARQHKGGNISAPVLIENEFVPLLMKWGNGRSRRKHARHSSRTSRCSKPSRTSARSGHRSVVHSSAQKSSSTMRIWIEVYLSSPLTRFLFCLSGLRVCFPLLISLPLITLTDQALSRWL